MSKLQRIHTTFYPLIYNFRVTSVTEFAQHTKNGKDGLFCFFEGKDNAYYVPRIKNKTDKYYPIKCGGRDKVLGVHRLISKHREYDKYKKAFFIDRDFNESLKPQTPPVYETPCYSIENLYVSIEVFTEILKNEFHLSEVSDADFYTALDIYLKRQHEFHEAVLLINAWYACLINIRNSTGVQTGVNLEDKLPKGFVSITLESVTSHYDIERIKQYFTGAGEISEEMLNAKLAYYRNCDYCKIFRGKYEMEFLIKIVHLLLKDSLTVRRYIKSRIGFVFGDGGGLSNEQVINIFSAYAETPADLNLYLDKVLLKS